MCRLENFVFESAAPDAHLKLIDFGTSHKYGSGIPRMHSLIGTAYYLAPEVSFLRSASPSLYTLSPFHGTEPFLY